MTFGGRMEKVPCCFIWFWSCSSVTRYISISYQFVLVRTRRRRIVRLDICIVSVGRLRAFLGFRYSSAPLPTDTEIINHASLHHPGFFGFDQMMIIFV